MLDKETKNSMSGVGSLRESYIFLTLQQIVKENGRMILLERAKLEEYMRKQKLSEEKIMQVLLITQVTGFKQFLIQDNRTVKSDLERFVQNALEETGLRRTVILSLVADIANVIGYPVVENSTEFYSCAVTNKKAFVIPYRIYEKELQSIVDKLNEKKNSTDAVLDEQELRQLTELVDAGIPEAKYLMGEYLEEENPKKALELIEEASIEGIPEAQLKMGDLYYDSKIVNNWGKAYECYTGLGAVALNTKRRKALKNILNQKMYNMRLLIMGSIFWIIMLMFCIINPINSLYTIAIGWKIVCMMIETILMLYAILYYNEYPYCSLNLLLPGMFGIWGIYLILWIL